MSLSAVVAGEATSVPQKIRLDSRNERVGGFFKLFLIFVLCEKMLYFLLAKSHPVCKGLEELRHCFLFKPGQCLR